MRFFVVRYGTDGRGSWWWEASEPSPMTLDGGFRLEERIVARGTASGKEEDAVRASESALHEMFGEHVSARDMAQLVWKVIASCAR